MYKYEYETVSCALGGWGVLGGNVISIENYRAVIDRRAAEGWEYVGCIPRSQRAGGFIETLDLVFQREYRNI